MVSSVPRNSLRLGFQLLVNALRAADEAHRRQPVAPAVQRLMRGGEHVRVFGQAQIIVGAEIQHRAAVADPDMGVLRRRRSRARS